MGEAATVERDAGVDGGGPGRGGPPGVADGPSGSGADGAAVDVDGASLAAPAPRRRARDLGAREGRDAEGGGDPDGPVRSVSRYRNNGELIAAASRLGHLSADWLVADVTYGKGTFWRVLRPERLVASDLHPHPGHRCDRQDATALPYSSGLFDAVVVDAPYKLNGTDQGEGARYGVDRYAGPAERHGLMRAMLAEAARVTREGGRVLFKCQDQVCNGELHWQTFMAYGWAAEVGLVLVEKLDYAGGRPQPARTRRRCLACSRPKVEPKHRCRNVADWLTRLSVAELTTLRESSSTPWLEEYPSPQEHAYYRPSSLLIFERRPDADRDRVD